MKILITRPRLQASGFGEALQAIGCQPVYFPVIEIQPIADNPELDQALGEIQKYDWVVFTSVNGVEVVFDAIDEKTRPSLHFPRVAAIGPKTAEALRIRGVAPDFVPEEYVAEAILPGLGDLRGKRILLLRAEIARKALTEEIVAAGGLAHEIAVYKTLPAQPEADALAALRSGVDVVTLTSPSTLQNFLAIARQNGLDPLNLPNNPLFACIGPITERAAKEEGLTQLAVAKTYTSEGLVELIAEFKNKLEAL